MSEEKNTKQKVVLVTGPAGNLGTAVVERFMESKSSLVLIDRHESRILEHFAYLADSPDHLLLPGVDLVSRIEVENAVDQAMQSFGRIDCLVHTVGGFDMGQKVHQITEQSWDRLIDINLTTLLNTSRAVLPAMLKQETGVVISIGARPGQAGKSRMAAYSAAKGAMMRLTESMAADYKNAGIIAKCLIPGTIDTPENRQAFPDADRTKWTSPTNMADVIFDICFDQNFQDKSVIIPLYKTNG